MNKIKILLGFVAVTLLIISCLVFAAMAGLLGAREFIQYAGLDVSETGIPPDSTKTENRDFSSAMTENENTVLWESDQMQLEEGLFLQRSFRLDKPDAGSRKKLVLKFENTGSEAKIISHTEEIPKTIAVHVDDIHFSIPPTKVINPDPRVHWELRAEPNTEKIIEIQAVTKPSSGETFMDVGKFAGKSCAEKLQWIEKRIGPYRNEIMAAAKKHNIPPRLLATVILNELVDYDMQDWAQESIPNTGSVGIAQINVNTAIKHNLVDYTQKEIDGLTIPYYPDPKSKWFMDKKQYLIWEKLNHPPTAIEGAAREISFIFDNLNKNLGKTWASNLMAGPLDKANPYANLKPSENLPSQYQDNIEREYALAVLVIGAYNTDTIVTKKFKLEDPYKIEKGNISFKNARNHAINSELLVSLLAKKKMFEAGELNLVDEICCGGEGQTCCQKKDCYATADNLDKWLMCVDNKCVKCGGSTMDCCENQKCKPKWGLHTLECEDGKCVRQMEKTSTSSTQKTTTTTTSPETDGGDETTFVDGCELRSDAEKKQLYEYGGYAEFYLSPQRNKDGPYTSYWDREKTQKKTNGCYKDGLRQGTFTEWGRDGNKKSEKPYTDDKLDGSVKSWSKGTLKEEKQMKMGQADGIHKKYFSHNGKLSMENNWVDGEKHGIEKTYYYPDGQLKEEIEYDMGEWTGKKTGYATDGKIEVKFDGTVTGGKFTGSYYTNRVNAPPTMCRQTDGKIHDCEYVDAI